MRRAAIALSLGLAACGSGEELRVSAASSLKPALEGQDDVRVSFGGSEELAAQIRQGAQPDVYAAANTELPDALYREGLVEKPVVFAANRLVLAVPPESRITAVEDLARPGLRIAVGAPSVPVGAYTRQALERLPGRVRDAILANVRSEEPDVSGVVGKLVQGAVDAGFVYITDVRAVNGRLRAVALDAPKVRYGAAVVKGAGEEAREFLSRLPELARAAGFEAP
jgi:molybdate transport system substrate-binding protein